MPAFYGEAGVIDRETATTVLEELNGIGLLHGNIARTKDRGSWIVKSVSSGKPWFGYHEYVPEISRQEQVRVRSVERWLKRSAAHPFGVVKVLVQQVFTSPRDPFSVDEVAGKRVYEEAGDESLITLASFQFMSTGL